MTPKPKLSKAKLIKIATISGLTALVIRDLLTGDFSDLQYLLDLLVDL